MRLINGDCLTEMMDISDNSIDLLFCDLPYGQTSCKWDCVIDLKLFWEQVNRICKITTPMFFTCSTKFGVSLINSNQKNFRYDLVWVKSASSAFLLAKKMPMKKHEMIYVFYRKLPYYDLSSHTHKFIKEPKSKEKTLPLPQLGSGAQNKVLRQIPQSYDPPLPNSVIKTTEYETIYGTNQVAHCSSQRRGEPIYNPPLPNSILEVKSEKGKHATQKPIELMKWILKYYSKEGDIVLDPTMGSGSTGLACKEMNREFIGIELNEEIFKVAEERLK